VIIILDKYPRLVDTKKNRSAADPFVIAQAMASNSIVVTEEISARGSKSPKIPDVCSAFNIDSINVLEFMRRVGMKFKRV